jgi:ABC-type Mn2+/Zn2+ transport system ATPase subunit
VIVATHDLASATHDYDLVLCVNRRVVGYGRPEVACTEEVLRETFAGRIVRVGSLMVDVSEHHEVH